MELQLTKISEHRRLTVVGWLMVCFGITILIWIWANTIHDFLAQNKPINTQILVIEGYVPDSVLDTIVRQFKDTPLIVCAGLPLIKGNMCSNYDNYADYNAAVLKSKGIDSLHILSAPSKATDKERTYTTALAVKNKLKGKGYMGGNLNIICSGTHGRRSGLLYRKALKPEWNVGVISFTDNLYDHNAWWHTSEGAREVVYEMFAYLYCVLFFHP